MSNPKIHIAKSAAIIKLSLFFRVLIFPISVLIPGIEPIVSTTQTERVRRRTSRLHEPSIDLCQRRSLSSKFISSLIRLLKRGIGNPERMIDSIPLLNQPIHIGRLLCRPRPLHTQRQSLPIPGLLNHRLVKSASLPREDARTFILRNSRSCSVRSSRARVRWCTRVVGADGSFSTIRANAAIVSWRSRNIFARRSSTSTSNGVGGPLDRAESSPRATSVEAS
jgi:hypothetical protein